MRIGLAIVGGGPNCTYATERLAADLSANQLSAPLEIHIFEKSGHFGSGWVHSPTQPISSMLNRIAGQITFAADETNIKAEYLLPKEKRPTFLEWCQQKYRSTGDESFNFDADDWPQRYIHGMALMEMFNSYVEILQGLKDISVYLHKSEVIDVEEFDGCYLVTASEEQDERILVDHILFLTGHSMNKPTSDSYESRIIEYSENSNFKYVPYSYPLETNVLDQDTGPDKTVGCIGLGLTAIDVILYLSEGRDGKYVRQTDGGRLIYIPSGREPRKIVAISQSGVFTAARAHNAKQVDIGHYEHKGVFLTENTIDRLRENVGTEIQLNNIGPRKQLDFERHILPVLLLEMACLYYKTLMGEAFSQKLVEAVSDRMRYFLSRPLLAHSISGEGVSYLLSPCENLVSQAIIAIQSFLRGGDFEEIKNLAPSIDLMAVLKNYFHTIHGKNFSKYATPLFENNDSFALRKLVMQWVSPFGHSIDPRKHLFDWDRMINPVSRSEYSDEKEYTDALVRYMDYDFLQSKQGNIENPEKAACDGVWRDLRQVLAYAADFGGLTAASHNIFIRKYMRYHNRIANGTCTEIMEKMVALIRSGLLDVSSGPNPEIRTNKVCGKVNIVGPHTGSIKEVDILLNAKLHDLNVRRDLTPLYKNLLERGFIKQWSNPALDGTEFEPGGLCLTPDFHPVDTNGNKNNQMTFLGPPSEGVMFFQVGAARPNQNHHVLNDIIRWVKEFKGTLMTSFLDDENLNAPSEIASQ